MATDFFAFGGVGFGLAKGFSPALAPTAHVGVSRLILANIPRLPLPDRPRTFLPMEQDDLSRRLDTIEATIKEVNLSSAEAKGAVKAGMLFVGALNTLFLPAVFWLFSSALNCRDANIAQEVKIEKLENACVYPRTAIRSEDNEKPKDVVKPAASEKQNPPRVSMGEP